MPSNRTLVPTELNFQYSDHRAMFSGMCIVSLKQTFYITARN